MSKIIEIVKHDKDFFSERPQILNNEFDRYGKMALVDAYGLIFDEKDKAPVLFVRHGKRKGYRFAGFCRLNEDPLGVQTPLHYKDMEQVETENEFSLLSEDPWIYGYGSKEPFSKYRYFEEDGLIKGAWKEGDFFEGKAEPFPYAIIQHMGKTANFTEIIQPAIVTGTFEGKPVRFLGSFDKVFMPSEETKDIGATMAYNLILDHGIRPDGRKESFIVYINDEGKSMGLYYLEGEEPVVSEDVGFEAEWFLQPCVDDRTVMYKDAIFHVGNKTIHFIGKWGCKGITAYPRYEKHGQSQIFGTWYEGDEPYEHTLFTTFHENMEAYDYKYEKLGRKIVKK